MNYVGRNFFFLSFESKRFEISETIVTKKCGLNVKNYFNEKNKISKKSKFKSISAFFKNEMKKLKILTKILSH